MKPVSKMNVLNDIDKATERVYEILEEDITSNTTEKIKDLLELTRGINGSNVYYRVYYTVAWLLWLLLQNDLLKGEGATFNQNITTTRRYLEIQGLLDSQQNLTIPVEFQVSTFLEKIKAEVASKECDSTSASVSFLSF